MISPVDDAGIDVGAQLLVAQDATSRASIVAAVVIAQYPNCACAVHRFNDEEDEAAWRLIALAGDVSPDPGSVGSGNRLMAPLLLESPEPRNYSSADILREDYAHLHITRSVSSIAYVPLLIEEQLIGAIEILFFSGTPRPQEVETLLPLAQLGASAI